MSSPLVHIEVTGRDGEKLKAFFSDLFGWEVNSDNPMNYGMIGLGSQVAGGIGAATEGPGAAMFYVRVDDVDASLERAEQLGGSRVWGPMELPAGGKIAHFGDPEGHVVGLFDGM